MRSGAFFHATAANHRTFIALLFSIAIFLSAALLFWVQPMIAKMLLPLLGGAPAVWNTCMVFFQAVLLAGYAYSHFLTRLPIRAQIGIHAALVAVVWATLPIHLPEAMVQSVPADSNPTGWLLACLARTVGLPFFVVSTTGPLLQRWFSHTSHASAKDPYFLYAASNLGSLLALLGYPVLLEPLLRLREQSATWQLGYAAFGFLLIFCAVAVWRSRGGAEKAAEPSSEEDAAISFRQRLRWIFLSFIPSSLMLGVTTYLTTDIASIPLLWVLPLSLYLLSFILVFARRVLIPLSVARRMLAPLVIAVLYLLLTEATHPAWMLIALNLLFFFAAAMACHGALAAERPPARHLTEFYLLMSVGGVMGGLFNALAAPVMFSQVMEYPIAVILSVFTLAMHPSARQTARERKLDFVYPLAVGAAALVCGLAIPFPPEFPVQIRLLFLFGLPLLASYLFVDRPLRFGLALGGVLLASAFFGGLHGKTLALSRNFFGVLRVTLDPSGAFRRMVHGNTIHGRQFVDPARQCQPLSYYYPSGPIGQVFQSFRGQTNGQSVAIIGLGTGALACYEQPGQRWTYYEINPDVLALARNSNYFSYMTQCSQASTASVVLGDARLRLREAREQEYGLIVIDAFSSDSIPIHLITREALELYLSKLQPGGMMVFHISNRSLDLEPVLGDLAGSLNLYCATQDEAEPSSAEAADGKDQSHWVILARQREDMGRLSRSSLWLPVLPRAQPEVWTDDFSNILSVFRWD